MGVVENVGGARDVLTQAQAEARARDVADVSYRIELDLRAGVDAYAGRAVIAFTLRERGAPVSLDFTGSIEALLVNGVPVEPDHRDHRLRVPLVGVDGRVEVEVRYRNAYDHTGAGFHRFTDPEDGAEYVHSDFEPFAAHRMFPCFDQPDLKATYELRVDAPADWVVVSCSSVEAVEPLPDARLRHRFARTPRFSTYLFAVVAGPYARVTTDHQGIPLGVYGRRSMAAILEREAPEILEVTAQGLDLYRRLFGQAYAFGKYDQLFVPEFNAGAMENVAAVTFHDSFLFRDPPTEDQRLERAEVVLHELAHMWFGDLTTLRWWDDLWLNESFATWASFHALATATRFRDAWKRFNGVMKPAAYRDDQRVTTHPVATPVPDTDTAQTNFDAITYEKGASALHQLVATIGEDAFAAGMQRYFERHAWGNATLDDFLAALGDASGHPLTAWADGWLRTAGTDIVTAHWEEVDGHISDLHVAIAAPDPDAPPRTHAMHVGLVHGTGSDLRITALPVLASGSRTSVPGAEGLPVPRLVFPNHGDLDFARTVLDERSAAFALASVGEVPDPLLRQLLWSTLWDMVREGRLPSTGYLDAVGRLLPDEPDQALADAVLEHAVAGLSAYVPEDRRVEQAARFIDGALGVVTGGGPLDVRRTWLRAAAAAAPGAIGSGALERLFEVADHPDASVPVDQDLRWSLAITASAAGRPDATERVAREAGRDRSDRGVRAGITAAVATPDPDVKSAAWERINGAGYGSFQLTRAAMRGFQWPSQRGLLEPFRDGFFAAVQPVFAQHEYAFARTWLRLLFPGLWAEAEVVQRARSVLAGLGAADATLARHLREVIDDQERMIRVRARAAAA